MAATGLGNLAPPLCSCVIRLGRVHVGVSSTSTSPQRVAGCQVAQGSEQISEKVRFWRFSEATCSPPAGWVTDRLLGQARLTGINFFTLRLTKPEGVCDAQYCCAASTFICIRPAVAVWARGTACKQSHRCHHTAAECIPTLVATAVPAAQEQCTATTGEDGTGCTDRTMGALLCIRPCLRCVLADTISPAWWASIAAQGGNGCHPSARPNTSRCRR